MSDEITVLICQPIAAGGIVVPGSIESTCTTCGAAVWVAPTGQALLCEHADARAVCVPCGLAAIEREPGALQPITPAQIAEVRRTLRGRS